MTPKALEALQSDLSRDVMAFLPEVVLCATIVVLLLIRLFSRFDRLHLGTVALVLTVYAFMVAGNQWLGSSTYDPRVDIRPIAKSLNAFGGLLVYDNFTIFLRMFLLGFVALVIWLTMITGIPDTEDS